MAVDLLQARILLSRYYDFVGGKTKSNWLRNSNKNYLFPTFETRRELELKYIPYLSLGSLLGARRSAIGHFFLCS